MQAQEISTATPGTSYRFLSEERQLILAASLGTIFEWYDFFLYGSLAVTISKQFFSGVDESTAFLFALLAFAAGFIVRPFGAVFFGRLGDLVGRKYTFLSTMLIMGLATMTVGVLPGYSRLGIAAPLLLLALRLLQGLAVTVVWYTTHFYVLYLLTQSVRVDPLTANLLLGSALLLGSPFFILFGRLSDRIGRKPLMLLGMLVAALTLLPLFNGLAHYVNPQPSDAVRRNPVVVVADPRTCGFQFDPLGQRKTYRDCDKARALLSRIGVPYSNRQSLAGESLQITIGTEKFTSFNAEIIRKSLRAASYPEHADSARMNLGMVIAILTVLILLAAMISGPLAAALVELFPTRIRYTALSVPYHAGVGWIGGLLPTVAFSLVVATGNIYYGLWYPAIVVFASFSCASHLQSNPIDRDLIED